MGILEGKVAIVTGAGRGIGRGEALELAAEGASVVVNDVGAALGGQGSDQRPADEAVDIIRARGGTAVANYDDVADWEGAKRMIDAAVEEFGRLDILVNNAGISGSSDPDTTSTPSWDNIMSVNAKGVFLGMKHAVPAMRRSGGGAIVNISSISGFVGQDRLHMAYNASKGAVRIMTKSAAVQYARDGVRVNSVHPGFMPPMRTSKVSADPAWRQPFLDAVPMKREGRVEEVAHAVLFLASDEASYITGTELVVDGGFLAV
jgi:NAD(P)-dependent dehydrogenase (short-subunit alcohol dehydrogenase family)